VQGDAWYGFGDVAVWDVAASYAWNVRVEARWFGVRKGMVWSIGQCHL